MKAASYDLASRLGMSRFIYPYILQSEIRSPRYDFARISQRLWRLAR
jgi:hypothetical protein